MRRSSGESHSKQRQHAVNGHMITPEPMPFPTRVSFMKSALPTQQAKHISLEKERIADGVSHMIGSPHGNVLICGSVSCHTP